MREKQEAWLKRAIDHINFIASVCVNKQKSSFSIVEGHADILNKHPNGKAVCQENKEYELLTIEKHCEV